jgi:hypothetical protein
MSNYNSRIKKIEQTIQEIQNPDENKTVVIIVNEFIGETMEAKIAEREKELGRKLKRKNLLIVILSRYRGRDFRNKI